MIWKMIICLAAVAYIFYRILNGSNDVTTKGKQQAPTRSTAQKGRDDFAGNSIGAYFFLEEFIDPVAKKSKVSDAESVETEWIEEEYLDDCFFDLSGVLKV
jgi:hypothetical protein